jgi:putative transposase
VTTLKRTVSIKLKMSKESEDKLQSLQHEYASACNLASEVAFDMHCFNRTSLHHEVYYAVRAVTSLGSQMTCNAIHSVTKTYKSLRSNKRKPTKAVFRNSSSIHFDKKTYSFSYGKLSLYTLSGRILVDMLPGFQQLRWLEKGVAKEGELIFRGGRWFFNLVLDVEGEDKSNNTGVLGVDVGENNLATTSTGKIFGGGSLRDRRDRYLNLRGRLQSHGTKSAKQSLKRVSGKEARRAKQFNHEVSTEIVSEAIKTGCGVIVLEDLTHIRDRIKAGKRMRTRLHRWPFRQLQDFVEYKAVGAGLKVIYVNPSYTSQTCSVCQAIGQRSKHRFSCKNCGSQLHSDCNAAVNISRLGMTAVVSTGIVDCPNVATGCRL